MDRCELSDLPVDQCACRKHGPKEAVIAYHDSTDGLHKRVVIKSKFDSSCNACGFPINEGDDITPMNPGYGRAKWIHLECLDEG